MKGFIIGCSGITIGYIPVKIFYFYNVGIRIKALKKKKINNLKKSINGC